MNMPLDATPSIQPATDAEPLQAPPTALQLWYHELDKRLHQCYPSQSPDQITRDIFGKLKSKLASDKQIKAYGLDQQICLDEVKAWVLGADLPRERPVFDTLLEVLGPTIKTTIGPMPIAAALVAHPKFLERESPITRRSIEYHRGLAELYEAACREVKDRPRALNGCVSHTQKLGAPHPKKILCGIGREEPNVHFKDKPYMPQREIVKSNPDADLASYEELAPFYLKEIVANTTNISEFLHAWRLLQPSSKTKDAHMSKREAAEQMGVDSLQYHRLETGEQLPTGSMLEAAKGLFAAEPKAYDRFTEILIANRVGADAYSDKSADKSTMHTRTDFINHMPRVYWMEVLRQANGNRNGAPEVSWAKNVRSITNKGEYFTAIRHVMGLSQSQVADEVLPEIAPGARRRYIMEVEVDRPEKKGASSASVTMESLRERLAEYYTQRQEAQNRHKWFSPKTYAKLPDGTGSTWGLDRSGTWSVSSRGGRE